MPSSVAAVKRRRQDRTRPSRMDRHAPNMAPPLPSRTSVLMKDTITGSMG